MILASCLFAATVYGLGSGRARLSAVPARPSDRAFLVRIWGELRPVPELPAILIEPRPFVMEPYPAPSYGPEPGWGLAVSRRARPSARQAGAPRAVMASHAPALATPEPAAESGLADAPEPERVRAVVASLRGRAERCYEATMVPGRVELLLVVDGATGDVRAAHASGAETISRCIERAALALRFPLFARASISIQQSYTFR